MNKNLTVSNSTPVPELEFLNHASGPVTIRMSNDYLFRALLQTDNEALRGLICALLHLNPGEVRTAEVVNPIELGSSMESKDFVLDVKIRLNNSTIINIELQVINRHNWPERSLSYLCRAFDNLNSGEDYALVRSAAHIGLLDFTLFPELLEFYATYQMLNVKNHALYSDKLRLSVVDLTRIDLATEEDKLHHIDKWASLFKAATWEEIKMIAKNDESITMAAGTVWKLSQEERIRQQCEAREDYYRCQRDMQHYMEAQEAKLAKQAEELAKQEEELTKQAETIAWQHAQLEKQEGELEEKKSELDKKKNELEEKESQMAVTLVWQILNFSKAGHSPKECADMLGADYSFVNAAYNMIRDYPKADAAQILEILNKRQNDFSF